MKIEQLVESTNKSQNKLVLSIHTEIEIKFTFCSVTTKFALSGGCGMVNIQLV
jgi:hypothetical protein